LRKAAKAENIENMLKKNGYSEKVIKEILKWYCGAD
jgi:predicted Ser/Thr protein kinase